VNALTTIQDGIPLGKKTVLKIINLEKFITGTELAIKSVEIKIAELKPVIATKEKDLLKCEKEYRELTANELKLTRL